ncbi:ExbD/TolR family protein [Arenimonas sp.]|uniref:ExbD/TolR family protein n=1 Tax=Arenimonas sp. TaxID=1872635 RepID=UPI0039E48FB4
MALLAARSDQMAEINITPLVDVMLVLLVIFMIAAPTLTHSVPLDLPQKGPRPPVEARTLELVVTAGDEYVLAGEAMSPAQLESRLHAELSATEQPLKLAVITERDTEYQTVARAVAAARNAGADNLEFSVR